MSTAFAPSSDHRPAPGPRPPWRALALLTVAVVLIHLALLGLLPPGSGQRRPALAETFITRSIVVAPVPAPAPPAAAEPAASAPPAAAPAAPAAARPPSPPRPVRPRAAVAPKPAAPAPAPVTEAAPEPEPAPDAAPAAAASPGDLPAQAAVDGGAGPAAEGAANAPAATSGNGNGATAGSGNAAGQFGGPVAVQIPGSVRLRFAATAQQGAQPLQGVFGVLDWLQDGSRYDARLALTFLFKTLRSQQSAGVIGPTGIEPQRFSDTRKTELVSQFDREKGQVFFSSNAPSVMLLAGAQDRLSVVLQLGAMMAGEPTRYPPGTVIAVQTVGPRDGEIWTFNVGEEEEIEVPAGVFKARKLTRNPRKPFDDKIELWLAPVLGWLPVRIRQTQTNGDFVDLQLRDQGPI
ncbi:DUF3108 domain-containing protein [Variovorax sp. J22P168]|uniref:DUF3108 domain-containing protein n=1 Tax=Variovorax jilinensis TaxID=3053513 RepID=UPI00257776B7|nr:DUF3108 domain-containing protein [Variovorax sp. J22P168]MDM0010939.1 DUF3108 domain-containing protein [Variovorax sp. J22P168]